ncbi:hypothetical protein UB46_34625 [Burkholderiaceae bacterium 16]|nr:hypothetical protein UB46_34625 [Burkholderiaceae bacterium 16]
MKVAVKVEVKIDVALCIFALAVLVSAIELVSRRGAGTTPPEQRIPARPLLNPDLSKNWHRALCAGGALMASIV